MRNKKRSLLKKYYLGSNLGYFAPMEPDPLDEAPLVSNEEVNNGIGSGNRNYAQGISAAGSAISSAISGIAAANSANKYRRSNDLFGMYEYDPEKSVFSNHLKRAQQTSNIMGAISGTAGAASSIAGQAGGSGGSGAGSSGGAAGGAAGGEAAAGAAGGAAGGGGGGGAAGAGTALAIIQAGFGIGQAGTEAGITEFMDRDRRSHEEVYKTRRNIGGIWGDFATQGQFSQFSPRGEQSSGEFLSRGKMGGYLDKYRGGGLYANIHAKQARIKAGSGEKMRSPGDKGAPTAANFERAAKTAKKQMGGSVPEYGASGMVEYGYGGMMKYQNGGGKKTVKEEDLYEDQYGNNFDINDIAISSHRNSNARSFTLPQSSYDKTGFFSSEEKQAMFADNPKRLFIDDPDKVKGTQAYEALSNLSNPDYPKGDKRGLPLHVRLAKGPMEPSNFKNGGMKKYMGGGMAVSNGVPRKYANAELEGGEVIEKQAGPDIYVKGPSHEKGGVPMKLQEGGPAQGGDYVWSDHLTFKGKTMAELYAMAVDKGASEEEIDQLRMLQEQLAGRAGEPQDAKELQEMPAAKTGGMLKKYQKGSGALGEKSFGEQVANYTPEIASGIGALAQVIGIATAKNPYEGMKAPKPNLIATPEKQFFERTDSRAQEAANQRGASLSKQLLQQAGFGPGETAALQKIELDRAAADDQAVQRAREFNIQQDRAEKQLNTELKLRTDIANQEVLNKAAEAKYALELEKRMFETERTQAGTGAVAGMARDVAATSGDYREALAIQGKQLSKRSRTYDQEKAEASIRAKNPYDQKKETMAEYEARIQRLVNEDAKKHQDYLNSKR